MLGMATKAGKVVSGEFATEKAVKSAQAYLVIVASDASDNTKKMFTNMCNFYNVPLRIYGNKESLAHAIGKEMRASVAVTEQGFSDVIIKHMDCENSAEV
ncbi:MAG: ribosomal L7Ae/L30e/S12e/Gadd45 family protein [Lachnospiraceae bacterium]|nr:ribosomal L7Ae/L30e/S12e/Gadd45 family protein [Lachnospiraceae bacterium]